MWLRSLVLVVFTITIIGCANREWTQHYDSWSADALKQSILIDAGVCAAKLAYEAISDDESKALALGQSSSSETKQEDAPELIRCITSSGAERIVTRMFCEDRLGGSEKF